jgi:hypothetical protein
MKSQVLKYSYERLIKTATIIFNHLFFTINIRSHKSTKQVEFQ